MKFKSALLYKKAVHSTTRSFACLQLAQYAQLGFLCLLLSITTSCNIHQFLEKDQYLVATNKVNIKNIPNKKTKKNLEYELTALYKQKELPTFLFFKRKNGAWFYFKGQNDTTTSKFKRWKYKSFSIPPAIYNQNQTELTVKNMTQFLKNKGYLYPTVFYDKDFHNKDKGYADVTYHADPGKLYVMDTVMFRCADTSILYLLNDIADESYLKKGAPLSTSLYELERQRITYRLNNLGYARFTSNYIDQMIADTVNTGLDKLGNRKANVALTIQVPNDKLSHLKFYTADVIVYPNFDPRLGETIAKDTIVDGKIFFTYDGNVGIRPQTLNKTLDISPGHLYNKIDIENSIRKMTNLGLYKYVNIRPNVEDCDSTLITYKVFLTPNKKMSFESGLEINYSNISQTSTDSSGKLQGGSLGRIGIAGDIGFEHKNLFNGAERLNSTISGGIDIGISGGDSLSNGITSDLRFDNNLSVPKFVKLSRAWQLLSQVGIIKKDFYKAVVRDASTNFNIGYSVSDRRGLNQYKLQQFNLGFKYVLKSNNGLERYTISPTGVELNINELKPSFINRLNVRTLKSFDNQLMTGFALRSISYDYNGTPNILNERIQYTANVEQSGTEIFLIEKIAGRKTPFKINDSLTFSKYWRGEIDLHYTRDISSKTAYAARLSVGLAVPFLKESNTPYSRLFYVGGPNSIRAWTIRGLGPGGFNNSNFTGVPFQAGDMKVDFNSEYRFPVFWRINSAIFLDAGNVWDIRESSENSQISAQFFKELAIGTGIGLRIDVTYAVIRIDFGYKLKNPYSIENKSKWIGITDPKWSNFNPYFALGLPF